MKVIMIMYDSLNRNYLPNYGGDMSMPCFQRLGEHSVTFDRHFAGSLPCMPARRELHTGRYNFLHREWGPLEPFDDSMPEILKKAGIYTHLISDHCHYWEDGGATYHGRYNSWQNVRGQEGDCWIGDINGKDAGHYLHPAPFEGINASRKQDQANRRYILERGEFPQEETFRLGREFIDRNHNADHWFLQIETFDPHEPFFLPDRLKPSLGTDHGYDWPAYSPVYENDSIIHEIREKYKALMRMCDTCLGSVLDQMNKYDMWEDTMLIVNTDHGLLVGEREWWGKNIMPLYNELVRLPLFIWDPRSKTRNVHRKALTQTIDLAPTILDFFGQEIPKDMEGKSLRPVVETDTKIRDFALFGNFGSHINITDGEWTYMRGPSDADNTPLNCYTLIPQNLMGRMPVEMVSGSVLHRPFAFTKECPVLEFPVKDFFNTVSPKIRYGNRLLRLTADGMSQVTVQNDSMEELLVNEMRRLMIQNDAPNSQYIRVGLSKQKPYTHEDLVNERKQRQDMLKVRDMEDSLWSEDAVWEFRKLCQILSQEMQEADLIKKLKESVTGRVETEDILLLTKRIMPADLYAKSLVAIKNAGKIE